MLKELFVKFLCIFLRVFDSVWLSLNFVVQVKEGEIAKKGGLKYLELKQLLLLSYCQAITFYLLLKSEGQPVRDHPVIARLVEIKNLLEKVNSIL